MFETGDNIYTTSLTLTTGAQESKSAISGVANSASSDTDVAANIWTTIQGSGLAAITRAWKRSDFNGNQLPAALDGTSVKIDGKDASVPFISPARLTVLAPADTAQGPVTVQAVFNGSILASATVRMQQLAPAFFLFNDARHIASTHADGSLLSPSAPAKPGELVILYGTGFGPVNSPDANGSVPAAPASLANPVTLRIGGVAVAPSFAGLTAPGLYQINVRGISSPLNAAILVQR